MPDVVAHVVGGTLSRHCSEYSTFSVGPDTPVFFCRCRATVPIYCCVDACVLGFFLLLFSNKANAMPGLVVGYARLLVSLCSREAWRGGSDERGTHSCVPPPSPATPLPRRRHGRRGSEQQENKVIPLVRVGSHWFQRRFQLCTSGVVIVGELVGLLSRDSSVRETWRCCCCPPSPLLRTPQIGPVVPRRPRRDPDAHQGPRSLRRRPVRAGSIFALVVCVRTNKFRWYTPYAVNLEEGAKAAQHSLLRACGVGTCFDFFLRHQE